MKKLEAAALSLLLPLGTALGATDDASPPQSWSQAGGIARLAMILFFAAVVTGAIGYSTIPPAAAKAGKALFAVAITFCIGLMLASIFIPGNPAQP